MKKKTEVDLVNVHVQVDVALHRKFKTKLASEGLTIKGVLVQFIEEFSGETKPKRAVKKP